MKAAEKLAEKAGTGDILVINHQAFRTVKDPGTGIEFLVPVEFEFHLNPLNIALTLGGTLVAGALGLLAGSVLWNGLAIPSPLGAVQVLPGLKESPFLRDLRDEYQERFGDWRERRRVCSDLEIGFDKIFVLYTDPTNPNYLDPLIETELLHILEVAKQEGCTWQRNRTVLPSQEPPPPPPPSPPPPGDGGGGRDGISFI